MPKMDSRRLIRSCSECNVVNLWRLLDLMDHPLRFQMNKSVMYAASICNKHFDGV
jgi:hypothetical protein